MEKRPNTLDRIQLIRELSHITNTLDKRVHSLEEKLEKCQSLVQKLKSSTGDTASAYSDKKGITQG